MEIQLWLFYLEREKWQGRVGYAISHLFASISLFAAINIFYDGTASLASWNIYLKCIDVSHLIYNPIEPVLALTLYPNITMGILKHLAQITLVL